MKLPDRQFAFKKYKTITGKALNLDNPVTYDDKVWWLKLNNRDPLMTKCSDKYLVRDYVKERGLGQILNELYGVYDNAEDIDFDMLPDRFILKTTHGCGGIIVCSAKAEFPVEKAVKRMNEGLSSNYFIQSREWNYKDIKPRIICERLFEKEESGEAGLVDYRFMCFDGVVKMVLVDIDTLDEKGSHRHDARRNVYDENFNLLDIRFTRPRFDPALVPKPENFDEMRSFAEILSEPFPHCRVDFYNLKGKIVFGEITFYHAGGSNIIEPEEWETTLGGWIDLNSPKVIKQNDNERGAVI